MSTGENEDWVARLKSDDSQKGEALEELRSFLVRGLMRSLSGRGGGEAFAEDIAQESLLKILKSLDTFSHRSKFTTWAMSIAIRTGISELRRRQHRDVSLDALTKGGSLQIELSEGPANQQLAEQQAEHDSILKKLRELIDEKLTDKQRDALQALLTGMPVEEIATRTNSNRNAVYKLVHDARLKLRQGFEDSGITASDFQAVFT